jgi:hypothetical protein
MTSLKTIRGFFLIALALGAGGCASSRSALMVPVRPSPRHTLAAVPAAKLRIPLVVSLPRMSLIEEHMAKSLKGVWQKDVNAPLAKDLGTKVWWDPLDWDFDGNTMTAHLHVHYKTADKENLGQEIEKDVKVDVASALKWTKDWHLEAPSFKESADQKEEGTEDQKGEKLLRKGTAKFHESLKNQTDFKTKAKELWERLQEPIQMSEDIWLQILPNSVSVGNSHLVPNPLNPRMETVLEIIAKPNVIFGHKPAPLKGDLPPLMEYKPGPDGFHAQSNLKISFKEINKLLTDPKTGLLGQSLPGSSDKSIKITGLRLYGSGGQIVVEAQVDYQPVLNLSAKPAQLTVYLLGTPRYREKEQVIDFPDMDFDVKSSDFLVQMANFIDGDGMKAQLRQKAVISVGKNLDVLKSYLVKMLNRPLGRFASLKTTITSFRMEEAFVSDYGIEGRVVLDGDADVNVNW